MNMPSDQPTHIYRAYSATIGSVFEIPAMLRADGPVDLQIRAGRPLRNGAYTGQRSDPPALEGGAVAVTFGDVATFVVRGGTEVIVHRGSDQDDNSLQHVLTGRVLAVALQQRGLLILHGDGVVIDEKAVLFLGDVGAGKSTTAGALYVRGAALLCDDVIAVSAESRTPIARSGFPRLKLDRKVADQLGIATNNASAAYPKTSKCSIHEIERFDPRPRPLAGIYVLGDGSTLQTKELEPQQAVVELIRHSYCAEYLGESYGATILRQCASVARAVPVRRLWRPRSLSCFDDLDQVVRTELG